MTIDEMVERVKGWITNAAQSTEHSLAIAENIRDECEMWIDALEDDLDSTYEDDLDST